MSSDSLPVVTVTTSARLSPSSKTSSLSTPVKTLQETSIADVLPTTLPQPTSRSGHMQFTDDSFPAMTVGIATGVAGGSLLAMFTVLIVVAVLLLIRKRKRKYSLAAGQDHHHDFNNPLYGDQG